ncbi:MAG: glycosyltransferase family A protein [Armatimonadota bacterium]|nr:glycosyltransferase family A protein [Armatimonadota bacterium]MDR7427542.1 glycosyltransferase family A protein [Armatimonadota bacterium]MDR7463448.1 glycosyltransferase family A protein [Armatimonadota bacterium]MDR7469706.1 glycosyltransferase family A protein [Armatimonadota bacterium]MDR7473961.1 glycosyltransferase family A protein [Armatimonadota bacterium]
MVSAPTLSVIIPTYNRAELLPRVLENLVRQDLPPELYEVLVVDDGSTDETPSLVGARAAVDGRIRLLRWPENRGRSAARNEGVRQARGEIVVFIDSDVLVRPDFLAHHMDVHRRASRAVLCRGPVVAIPDIRLPERLPATRLSPSYLDTANASLPRSELLGAGLFDEGFRAYGWEDIDLGFRLQRRGLRRVFRPEAVAFHVQPAPSLETFGQALTKEEERARTAIYLYRKYPGWRTRVLIQYTALHRIIYFLLAGGGLLNQRNVPSIAARLRHLGLGTLEYVAMRSVLNRHYLETLRREWRRDPKPREELHRVTLHRERAHQNGEAPARHRG